ncbi:MAG: hypothetical protein ACLS23_06535 [Clostridioides difficile]
MKRRNFRCKIHDDRMIQTPGIAVGNAFLEIKEMANYAVDSVKYATEGILNYSEEEIDKTFAMEKNSIKYKDDF